MNYLQKKYNLNDTEVVSVIDEVNLWAAPFGLQLLDKIHYKPAIKALDVGFGLGFPLIELAMRLGKRSKVYGIDPWKAGIERARLKLKVTGIDNVEIICGTAEQLPFKINFFDLIVSNNGINNVADIPLTLQECHRVLKKDGQFVFTFNAEETFIEFYTVLRDVINELGLEKYNKKISEHIYSRRKPLKQMKNDLKEAGFTINKIYKDVFYWRYADGSAMLEHFSIQYAFMEGWKRILETKDIKKVFSLVEKKLNKISKQNGGFSMQVPFYTIDCRK